MKNVNLPKEISGARNDNLSCVKPWFAFCLLYQGRSIYVGTLTVLDRIRQDLGLDITASFTLLEYAQ